MSSDGFPYPVNEPGNFAATKSKKADRSTEDKMSSGPDHHAEMEAHYAAGQQRQDEQHLFDIAFAEAKARVDAEIEREGWPPSAQILIAWGVGAGVRAATSRLMREIGDAREELSRLKIDASNHAYRAETARLERDKAEAEIASLRERLKDKVGSLRVEIAAKQGAHNEIRILESALRSAVRRLDEGHEIRPESQSHHDMQDALPDPA